MFLDKENSILLSQDVDAYEPLVTSKDTIHILRLSAILHVIHMHVNPLLGDGEQEEIATQIPQKRLLQAKALYNSVSQHKALFVQVRYR